MNYPNYNTKVVEQYQTKLISWTYCEFKGPFDIHTVNNVYILLEALQCGKCCWIRMTKSNMNHQRDEVNKRIAGGGMVGKARQPRSEKGISRPWKSMPGTGKGAGDKEDGALPAKKQRREKAMPKPCATTTKKPTRKRQLPPAHPTSNDFVKSDSDIKG